MRVALLLMTQRFYTISMYLYARVVQRNLRIVLVLGTVATAGCQSEPKTGATETAPADDFWPSAPKPTITKGARTFRYQPENIGRYRMLSDGAMTRGQRTVKTSIDVELRRGPTSDERNAHIERMDWTSKMGDDVSAIRISSDDFYYKIHGQERDVLWFQRAGIDVPALTESPVTIATFDPTGTTVTVRRNPDYPLEKLVGMGDMLDQWMSLFPDLPRESIAPGHHWSSTRNVPVGSTAARADTTIYFEYVGDSRCPSGVGACALFSLEASISGIDIVTEDANKVRATYHVAGKVFFNYERGAIDESRARAVTDFDVAGTKVTFVMDYQIEPRT